MLAPDLIGHGEDAWSHGDGAASPDAEAARIEAIHDSTCGLVCLRGRAYGAAVAARVALLRHHRVTALALYEPVLFSLITRDAPPNGEAARTPTRAIARSLRPVLPDARYVRVDGTGHMGPITGADIVNAEITRVVEAIEASGSG